MLATILATITACNRSNGIVGTWEAQGEGIDGGFMILSFNDDGAFTVDGHWGHGIYQIVNNDLIFDFVQPSTQGTVMGRFEIDGNTMYLTIWGMDETYIRN